MRDYEVVKFSEAYHFAHFTWSFFLDDDAGEREAEVEPMALLGLREKAVQERRLRPHRDTLLHCFLRRLYKLAYIQEFEQHRNDMLDLVVSEYEAILRFNGIPFRPFALPGEMSPDYQAVALSRVAYLRRKLPVSRIAQDTFQLLFRDRHFLLTFNQALAHASARKPRVRRVPLPSWLRRGVFYRDNGRCLACGKDLTGAGFLGDTVHFDHIVPIAMGGSNDPTNFQLLCDGCNHEKAATVSTSERYPVFWGVS